jgi:hypothetical protein
MKSHKHCIIRNKKIKKNKNYAYYRVGVLANMDFLFLFNYYYSWIYLKLVSQPG